jgi:hypothetical protein
VAKFLQRQDFLEQDTENSYLALQNPDDEAMQQLYGHSITYRIAIEPQQDRKVFTLQSIPSIAEPKKGFSRVAKVAGFLPGMARFVLRLGEKLSEKKRGGIWIILMTFEKRVFILTIEHTRV